MIGRKEFFELCKGEEYSKSTITRFSDAIDLAESKLGVMRRKSGNLMLDHNVRVGIILLENKAAPEVIMAGILHGLIDCERKIREDFGEEVWSLVEGLEDIKSIKSKNKNAQAEAIRKVLLTTLKDVRVILIKIANKIDNLRTIDALPAEDQEAIAQESLDIYAPLAYRLGVEKMKIQLEDLSFKILNPSKYVEIEKLIKESSEAREKNIIHAIELIRKAMEKKVKVIKIFGRSKHIYSIYKKMTEKKTSFERQYDLLGIRMIVPEEKDCYKAVGLLHESFEPIEGRLKDYIANPKTNLYQSIHTGIILPDKKIVEVQVRTPEMDELANEGIAAHWRYKGLKSEQAFEKKISWLRGILELQRNEGDQKFIEAARVNVFGDHIYCYTPKGDIKELPVGATVLDFAFAVHEQIGSKAIGGRVNGKFLPLREELKQGDVVEVVTSKTQHPRMNWITIVKSSGARQKIRKFLKQFKSFVPWHYKTPKPAENEDQGLLVTSKEFPEAACVLAKCCNPLPGDNIVGFVTKKRVVSVHAPDCRSALKEQDRWTHVEWRDSFSSKLRFKVNAVERSGLLADLLHNIAHTGFEVKEAKAKMLDKEVMECSFLTIPKDLETIKELVRRLQKVKGVKKIHFE